ncbi:MAG: GNAT family N-acetyltransferase [Bryobacterales bacterium]|nr:GNAT family N-acetyltransferase [Bryobacterales bacterium]
MPRASCESSLEFFDLPQFRLHELEGLLHEEVDRWRQLLLWNYQGSSDLVGQFIDAHALQGNVLCRDEHPIGYSYYILEDSKALLGCLFLKHGEDTENRRNALLDVVLQAIRRRDHIRRIEAQFMLHGMPGALPLLPEHVTIHERLFMRIELPVQSLEPLEPMPSGPLRVEPWHERYQDRAAYLIEESYRDHLDSSINDQYRSVDGARRFLYNIIQYPGCGNFAPDATFAAIERGTGRLLGCSLASNVDRGVGHITQICTAPAVRGQGMGERLLRESLHQLARNRCYCATLTVTASNLKAIALYEKLGFTVMHRFPAYVWEGF